MVCGKLQNGRLQVLPITGTGLSALVFLLALGGFPGGQREISGRPFPDLPDLIAIFPVMPQKTYKNVVATSPLVTSSYFTTSIFFVNVCLDVVRR
jgi:hypothetical protein